MTLKVIAASIGISVSLFCVGCGGTVSTPLGPPNISQVLPRTIAAGSNSVTMKVTGSNFTSQAVVLWNGSSLTTSVVDSNTLAATVASNELAAPAVAQLKVQNVETGQESPPVMVTVASASSDSSTGSSTPQLSLVTTTVPSGSVGSQYSTSLGATGGTAGYSWSIASGQLPAGVSLGASTGVLSGTPTASGTFSFSVKVADSSSPVETATAGFAMSVIAPPASPVSSLVIASSSLAGATAGASYSGRLSASGGTAPYSWSITSGQLPSGLSIAPATGVISGTPATSGTSSFTASVSDSGNPAQSKSALVSIVVGGVGSTPLTITTSSLPSGSNGTAYSTALQANGGTPAYTWSIASGSLPAGLTLAATTGVISGTPTATGASSFTAKVTDNGNPVQTQSVQVSLMVDAATQAVGPGTTWYVRTDGGTRYSSIMTSGQCDGQADAPYPGTGTDQHCAFNDVRWLWQDGSYSTGASFPSWGWVIAGGDTVIIRGSIGDGVSWRVGWNNVTSSYELSKGLFYGLQGDPFASGAPAPPSGTAAQHTRILGGNYGACTSQSARTQLHGGWGVSTVLSLKGSSYVDVACLDITDFSNCGWDNDSVACENSGIVISDFAKSGIIFDNASTHDTLTDIRIHGMASDGIDGPTGDGFVATDLAIIGNGDAGWNADLGNGTTGVGSFLVQNFDISWNGCVEEYPIVDPLPYFSCRDQSSGGYGDGFGTATVGSPAPGWQVHFDNGTVSYNTQDGLDALHISGPGSTMTDTRVLAFGNEGQQLKVGGATATIQNSVIVGNCDALTKNIPGTPAGFNTGVLDYCRAGNTAVLINVTPGDPATFQDNTVFEGGAIGLEVEYATSDTGSTNTLMYNNNVFMGFYNSDTNQNATPIYSNTNLKMLTNPGASWANNVTFGQRSNWKCPAGGETNAICTDPGLVDETYHAYGYGNMQPASRTSAVVGAGVAVPSITLDYTGQIRPNPPSIGAYEPQP